MPMDITKRFKYAVKQVCESLGIYPGSGGGGSAKGRFQLTIINNSDESDAELSVGSNCYRVSDNGDIIRESNTFYIEPGMTQAFNLCVLATNDSEDEDLEDLGDLGDYTYSYYLVLENCVYPYLGEIEINSTENLEEYDDSDSDSIDDGSEEKSINKSGDPIRGTREADAPSVPVYKITDPTKLAKITITITNGGGPEVELG